MCDSDKIRALNDAFRQTLMGGRVVVTRGLSDRADMEIILARVKTFADFTENNDPYGEHDFGSFDQDGDEIFWKIDYYDCDLGEGSPDPGDATVTVRVLTVMLASEY